MKTAKRLLDKKKAVLAEISERFGAEEGLKLRQAAEVRLDGILTRYASVPKGARVHTDHFIFPSAAVYLTVREASDEKTAFAVIEDAAVKNSRDVGRRLARWMRVPGMKDLFVRIWDPMTNRMFGEKNGFKNVFYPKKKGEYRMDVVSCPYVRYFAELGCPELTKIFCENDERCYGNLPGLAFLRTGTLGKGAERCDFCLRRV